VGALFVVLLTFPTVPRAGSVGRLDTNDGRFSIWNIGWLDHAALAAPADLLNGNIFWPHRGTIAYSELNLVAGVFGLPWYAATGRALAALNGAVATGLLLTFVCMAALVRRLTASEGAGLVSATAFTFCPYVTAHTAHVQLLMTFGVPLVFLAFHALAEKPTPWAGIRLGAALAVAALGCGYYGIFAGQALGLVAMLWRPADWRRYASALAIAAATAVGALAPVFLLFRRLRAASGAAAVPHYVDLSQWSANLVSYLASSSAAHDWWLPLLRRAGGWHEVLFPGIAVIVFAGMAVVTALRFPGALEKIPRRLVWVYLALAITAGWASFGPAGHLWPALTFVPGMAFLRAPARLGLIVTFALAVVAGVGVARVTRGRRWVAAVLTVLVAVELGVRTSEWGWPSWPLRVAPPVPLAYQRLAQAPPGVVVDFPFPYVSSDYHNHASAMYWSTYHWHPLVNGYSDITPPDFDDLARPINGFPDPASFAIMRARGVRYVVWHIDYYRGDGQRTIEDRLRRYADDLRPLVTTGDVWLYEITGWPPGA
jgi:hypothetical protein